MKMSKKLLAFILSLGCIGALTACDMGAMGSSLNSENVSGVESVETPETPDDGGETPDDGGETPDDGGETPDDGGETPDDGGETPDDTAKGMSREEWERGISVVSAHENGTIEMGATSRASGEREEYLQKKANELTEVTYTVTKDGVSSSETKYFSAVKGEIPCVYVVEDGAWKKYESSQLSYEELSWFSKAPLVTYFASMYEQFTYDAENDVYYGASVELLYLTPEPSMKTMMLSDVRISFVNGVVSEITFDSEYEEDAYICFSNVGTTTVELPTVGEEVTPAVDWEGIFATMCGYKNYTIDINNHRTYADGSVENMRMVMASDVAASRILQEVVGSWSYEAYYSIEDGVGYAYTQTENGWEKITYPYADAVPVGSVLMGEAISIVQAFTAYVTYDANEGLYIGKNFTIELEDIEFNVREARIQVENGAVVRFEFISDIADEGEEGEMCYSYVFSNINTTVIELPVIEEVIPTVDWESVLATMGGYQNYTIAINNLVTYADGSVEDVRMMMESDVASSRMMQEIKDVWRDETYYSVEDGVEYVYNQTESGWEKIVYPYEDEFPVGSALMGELMPMMQGLSAHVTYDANEGVYIGGNFTIEFGGIEIKVREARMQVENDTVVWFEFIGNITGEEAAAWNMRYSVTIGNINTTVIELPVVEEKPSVEGMSKAEWDEAFAKTLAQTNYTMDMNLQQFYTDGRTETMHVRYDNMPTTVKYAVGDNVSYYDMEGDTIMMYQMADGQWTKKEYTSSSQPPFGSAVVQGVFTRYQAFYDAMSYDAENDCYVAKDITFNEGVEVFVYELRMKFTDGLLTDLFLKSNMVSTSQGVYGVAETTYKLSDYGTTVVELPVIEDEPVEEEAWQAIFDKMYTFDNLTLVIDNENVFFDKEGSQISTTTYKTTANALSLTVDSTNGTQRDYYERIDGVDYYYTQKDGKWVREAYTYGTLPIGTGLMPNLMISVVDACKQTTYNEAEEIYTAENIVVYRDDMAMTIYTIRVKVVDGALVWVESESDIVSSRDGVIGRSTSRMVWKDIGTTTVELPALEEDEPETDGNLTAEEWAEIIANTKASDKFAATIQKVHEFYNGEATQTEEYVYQVDGDKIWIKQTVNGVSGSNHFEKLGNQSYAYINHGEYYTKQLYVYSVAYGADMMLGLVGDAFDQVYAYLTYNAEEDAYCGQNVPFLNNGEAMVLRDVRIKVADGKIVLYEATTDIFDENGEVIGLSSASTVFENYGTMVVTLPETVTFYTVDALAWDCGLYGAMVMNNFTGSMIYTYEYSDGSPSKYYESYILMQENATYQYGVQNGREYQQYYAKVDGVDYMYTVQDGVWQRSEVGQQITYNNTNMASVMNPLRSLYASFVFDEEKGAYTCSEITLDLGNGSYKTIYNVELTFKDGVLTTLYYELALRNGDGVQNGVAKVTLSFWAMGETVFTLPRSKRIMV